MMRVRPQPRIYLQPGPGAEVIELERSRREARWGAIEHRLDELALAPGWVAWWECYVRQPPGYWIGRHAHAKA